MPDSSNWDLNSSNTPNNYLYDFGGSCAASNDAYGRPTSPMRSRRAAAAGPRSAVSTRTSPACRRRCRRNGPNYACNSQSLVTLTQDSTTLNSKIDALSAGGDTNPLTGFMWGWRTISPNAVHERHDRAEGLQHPTATHQGVIVFLTDGMNTWQRTARTTAPEQCSRLFREQPPVDTAARLSGAGRLGEFERLDHATTTATRWMRRCWRPAPNAKNAGVIVHTVGFSIAGAEIDTAGQNPAGLRHGFNHSFIATDSTSVLSLFAQIGTRLGKLRLVQ